MFLKAGVRTHLQRHGGRPEFVAVISLDSVEKLYYYIPVKDCDREMSNRPTTGFR